MNFWNYLKTLLLEKRAMKRLAIFLTFIAVLATVFAICIATLAAPAASAATPAIFRIAPGESFLDVAHALAKMGLVQSQATFALYSAVSGSALHFRGGTYYIAYPASVPDLAARFAAKPMSVTVRIPDGATARAVDALLAASGVTPPGAVMVLSAADPLEGKLFPDTYQFFKDSDPEAVVRKITDNFEKKAAPVLAADHAHAEEDLILASILEKEVPDLADQKIVAGIFEKRIAKGIPLQADATVCYVKTELVMSAKQCYPLLPGDYQLDSPHNTYRAKGLPPGPIGSPGLSAIEAAVAPQNSPYWFYLSDPKTGKTIFAKTLEEQNRNRAEYLAH